MSKITITIEDVLENGQPTLHVKGELNGEPFNKDSLAHRCGLHGVTCAKLLFNELINQPLANQESLFKGDE